MAPTDKTRSTGDPVRRVTMTYLEERLITTCNANSHVKGVFVFVLDV